MKAVQCQTYCAPKDLAIVELDAPTPKPGEVLIKVEAVGLGYVDALFITGDYQVKRPTPFIPGSEVSGTVTGCGEGVTTLKVGDRVLAVSASGGLVEQVCLPAATCIPLTDKLSSEAAASFLVSYCTAYYGLEMCGHLKEGESILILGAAGGVGSAAIDMARAMGAHVIAAASGEDKRKAALEYGAHQIVDYTQADWRKDLKGLLGDRPLNMVYDPVGGDVAEPAFRSLSPGGRFLVIGFASGEIPRIPLNLALLKRSSIVGVDWGGYIRADPANNGPILTALMGMVGEGKINPQPHSVHPLDSAGQVLQDLLDRKMIGKPVIKP